MLSNCTKRLLFCLRLCLEHTAFCPFLTRKHSLMQPALKMVKLQNCHGGGWNLAVLMEGSPPFCVAFQYCLCFQVKIIFAFEWHKLTGTIQFTRLKIMANGGGALGYWWILRKTFRVSAEQEERRLTMFLKKWTTGLSSPGRPCWDLWGMDPTWWLALAACMSWKAEQADRQVSREGRAVGSPAEGRLTSTRNEDKTDSEI